jgi:hypothetical protein
MVCRVESEVGFPPDDAGETRGWDFQDAPAAIDALVSVGESGANDAIRRAELKRLGSSPDFSNLRGASGRGF